jgi:hypothetical protein
MLGAGAVLPAFCGGRAMTARLIYDMPGLLEIVRSRRDALNVSHETIDHLAGFPAGYTSKLLSPVPMRGISHMSLGGLLGALGLALVVVEDTAAASRVRRRWTPRKRPSVKGRP